MCQAHVELEGPEPSPGIALTRGRRRAKPVKPVAPQHRPLTQQMGLAATRSASCKKQMRGRQGGFSKNSRRRTDVKLGSRGFLLGQVIPLRLQGKLRSFSRRESQVHGVGLFAEEPFKAGEMLGFFTGELLVRREALTRRRLGGKSVVEYEGCMYIDASRGRACPFQWVNSAAGTAAMANVQFVVMDERLCVETLVAVGKGDELLADYACGSK